MSDLSTLLRDAAETGPAPTPVDTTELWTRGRRQRFARRTAPVMAVLAVVGLGVGAVASTYGDDLMRPLTTEEGAPHPGESGWIAVPPVKPLDAAVLPRVPMDDETAPVVARIQTGHWGPAAPFDVDAEGSLVWVDPEHGILVRQADADAIEIIGMPAPFLEIDGEPVLFTVQWGPDGRIYLTGQDPESRGPRDGLTQIAVVERDGTLVGVRENDALQDSPLVFADGFAWHEQRSEVMLDDGTTRRTVAEGQQRWQAVAELGGGLLQMPEQRASEVIDEVAPDGMAADGRVLDRAQAGGNRLRLEVRVGDALHERELGSVGWGRYALPRHPDYRLWVGNAETADGWWREVTGSTTGLGGLLVVTDREGRTHALRNEGLLDRLAADSAFVGGDGYLYLLDPKEDSTIDVRRYAHRLPGADELG